MKKVYLLVCSSMFICFFSSAQGIINKNPNIIIILADDLGYHDVSYYGTKDIQTPNIDLLSTSGMRFDRFYSNSSVCSPTRASLMSGRYPERVGVPGLVRSTPSSNFGYLTPNTILLPELLKKMNYNTALVGKWNLGLESPNLPNDKGFDFFHGFLDDKMDDYYTHLRNNINFMRRNKDIITPLGHATDLFTNWAVDYIKSQENKQDPFFLYLAYTAPHTPLQPREDWLKKIKQRELGISDTRAKLIALIEHMDDGIGKLIHELKISGKYDNTLIIFLSDNGGKLENEANNGNIRGGKGSFYEGGVRVPAIFVWPGHIQAGSTNNQRAITMDVLPTISDILKFKNNNPVEGVSLLKILKNSQDSLPERNIFFTRREGDVEFGGQAIHMVISNNWKLVQNSPYQMYELYNLKKDTLEKQNLITTEPDRYKKLIELMIPHIQKGGTVPWQAPSKN
jgi:arylsulfatase A-like enzyme